MARITSNNVIIFNIQYRLLLIEILAISLEIRPLVALYTPSIIYIFYTLYNRKGRGLNAVAQDCSPLFIMEEEIKIYRILPNFVLFKMTLNCNNLQMLFILHDVLNFFSL